MGVRSLVVAPVMVDSEWWGFIGFDECGRDRDWSAAEIDSLKAAADTLTRGDMSPAHREMVEAILDNMEGRFVGALAEGRVLAAERVPCARTDQRGDITVAAGASGLEVRVAHG